ncbi:hypothetical protein AAEI02_13340 [Shewanella xiamenensis]|uniref:hypothetical protein n=1 Tax=Shewanella xiamenensis TaxID=332186 RepID=UPI00313CAD63
MESIKKAKNFSILDIISILMALTFGFCIGMIYGSFFPSNNMSSTININNQFSLVFTILGGTGGFLATVIALFVWSEWKNQQRHIKLYDLKISILTILHTIMLQTVNMAVMRANPSNGEVNSVRESLVQSLSKLHVELTVYEALVNRLSIKDPINLYEIKYLPEISSEILNLNTWPKTDTVDKLYISSTTYWQYERAKEFIYSLPFEMTGSDIRIIKISSIKSELKNILEASTKQLCKQL